MATNIKLKNSVTTTAAPSSLVQGEAAVNVTDKKLWVGNAATTPVQLIGAGASMNLTSLTTSSDSSISGLTVGKGGGAVSSNTAVGTTNLNANTTGSNNTAIGYRAALSNTTGLSITAVGSGALYTNTSGQNAVAVGVNSLVYNTTGSYNTALGDSALFSNTTANSNTAVGYQSLYSNQTGANNVAVGYGSLYATTSGANVGVGYQSLNANTSGNGQTAVGYVALVSNTTGTENTGLGSQALYSNTSGSYNVALGKNALQSNTTASNNTAVGYQAGYSNTIGQQNVFVGSQAGYSSTGANNYNTYVGYQAGYNANTTVNAANTFIGIQSGYAITTGIKNTIIGAYTGNQGGLDIRTASNYIVLSDGDGNPAYFIDSHGNSQLIGTGTKRTDLYNPSWGTSWIQSMVGAANIVGTNSADCMYSCNFYINSSAQDARNVAGYAQRIYMTNGQIQTQTTASSTAGSTISWTSGPYVANLGTSWTNSSDERLKNITGEITDALDKVGQLRAATYTWKSDESAKPQVGLIAQDLLKVLPEVVVVPESETDKDGNQQYMGVNYDNVIPLLVGAIKELKAEVDSLKQQLAAK